MPIYEFQCQACSDVQELMQKFSDPPPETCPKCGAGPMTKLISRTGFILNGAGWYVTDFRGNKDDKKKAADAKASSGEAASSDAPKADAAKADAAKADAPKGDGAKADAPKAAPKAESPKTESKTTGTAPSSSSTSAAAPNKP